MYDADRRERDWREWLKRQGYDPAGIFEAMVQGAAGALDGALDGRPDA